jgi:alkylhydroperoxidase family enzyme
MTWLAASAPGDSTLDRTFGLLPEAYASYRELEAQLWDAGLDRAMLERVRARIATMVGDAEGADPVRAAEAAAAAALGDADRAALAFAEQYVLDAHGVTDACCAAVVDAFGEPGAAALTMAVAVFEATSRFRVALSAEEGTA